MRLSFRVCGNVQGVGYRWFVKETAEKHSVSGWVRNALDGFLKQIKTGHPWAKVEKAETQEMLDQDNSDKDFHIKPTV